MSGNETKLCSNCGQYIDANKIFLHERMCAANVKKCPKCNKPFTIDELEDHIDQAHGETLCEFCKKKFPKTEIENHMKKCDSKMVPCSYCDLEVLLGELKDHQKACGAITEPCMKCGRYIQRKEMETHLLEGCPPPKNDRRSVEVVHNSNNKYSLDYNFQNNYYPVKDFIPEEFLNEGERKKIDIKIENDYNKSNLPKRPASGRKVLNNNKKKNLGNLGNNPKDIINKEINNIINNNENKEKNKNKININTNKTNNLKTKNSIKKSNINEEKDMKKENKKGPIPLIPIGDKNIPKNSGHNNFNNKKINEKNIKSSMASNKSKGTLNSKKSKTKKNKEEFMKTKDKLNSHEVKDIKKKEIKNEIKSPQNLNNQKGIITDEDYIANFNFVDVDDDQLMQQVIEQSLRDQAKK